MSAQEITNYNIKKDISKIYLFSPLIIRNEGEKKIFSIDYTFSEQGQILHRQVSSREEDYEGEALSPVNRVLWRDQIQNLIQSDKALLSSVCETSELEKILLRFEVEVVVQLSGFRLRVRALFQDHLLVDHWMKF